jgi:hypothetical protein
MTARDDVCAAVVDLQRHRPIMAWEVAHHLNGRTGAGRRLTEADVTEMLEALVSSGDYEAIRHGETWTFDDRPWPHQETGYRPTES